MSLATALSPAVSRPAHIPESALYDFDMFLDPACRADPHWMLLSQAVNFKASRDTDSFMQAAFSPPAMLALGDDIRALADHSRCRQGVAASLHLHRAAREGCPAGTSDK